MQRVDAARSRINALNPRVEVVASTDMQQLSNEAELSEHDLVILCDSDAATIVGVAFIIQLFDQADRIYTVTNERFMQKTEQKVLRMRKLWSQWIYLR